MPATNMASERDFGLFDLLLRSKPSARVISYEALIMWTSNKNSCMAGLSFYRRERQNDGKRQSQFHQDQSLLQAEEKRHSSAKERETAEKKTEQKQQKDGKMRQERVKLMAAVKHIVGGLNNYSGVCDIQNLWF